MLNHSRVSDHMTAAPYALDRSMSLSAAASSMRNWQVDPVPVFDGDELCGVLFARDLLVARELGSSPHDLLLRDVPLHEVYVTSADAPVKRVAQAMLRQNVTITVVQDGQGILGLMGMKDLVVALAGLDGEVEPMTALEPSAVRHLILTEHTNIRRLLQRVERSAKRIFLTPTPSESQIEDARESARTLCAVMESHLQLENQVLAPALEALDAWGQVRADRLRAEHVEQTGVLHGYLAQLEQQSAWVHDGGALAALAQQLVDAIRADMRAEEECVLRSDLLCDVPAYAMVETD